MIELLVAGADAPAIVDDCMSDQVGYRWRLTKDGYVYRKVHGSRVYLHHLVMPGSRYPEFVRDHINRDKLDNRASNLRWLTMAESAQNKGHQLRNAVGIRGVTLVDGRFRAVARLNHKPHYLGYFDTAEQAREVVENWRAEHMPFAA